MTGICAIIIIAYSFPIPLRMSRLRSFFGFLRRNKWKVFLALLVLLPIGGLAFAALKPVQPEYITETAKRGDLIQTVEAVGTVISERDLHVQFPASGIVTDVLVREGDRVTAGQVIARLRAGTLGADIAGAAARLRSAEADMRKVLEGARQEDLAVTEADVANKRASLEAARSSLKTAQDAVLSAQSKLAALKSESVIGLSGQVSAAGVTATQELTRAENSLAAATDVLANTDVQDAMIAADAAAIRQVETGINQAQATIRGLYAVPAPQDFEQALARLAQVRTAVSAAWSAVDGAFTFVSRLNETSYFTASDREAYKTQLAAERSAVQTALSNVDGETRSLRDASATYVTRIAAEEAALSSAQGAADRAQADVATMQTTVQIAEAQLQLKRSPPRQADIDIARASVAQARASLARAQADYANTVLTAPLTGLITNVNIQPGEFTPAGPAVTMLGESPYRVEMFVSEIDVPRVRLTQSGSVELDAFPGVHYALRVSEIDPAATDRDGVTKYGVMLDFVYPHDEFKIGMTGDVRIITGAATDVVSIPLRAVLERDDGSPYVRIRTQDGGMEERSVETGMEAEDGSVEVTGVDEGEVVIVLERN